MEKVDLRKAFETQEFKNYWAYTERKFWKHKATKNTFTYMFDDKENYAHFEVKEYEDCVIVKCNGEDITDEIELDCFDCSSVEILKCCAYYFNTRF